MRYTIRFGQIYKLMPPIFVTYLICFAQKPKKQGIRQNIPLPDELKSIYSPMEGATFLPLL